VLNSTFLYPLTEIYLQATSSAGGALGLLTVMTIPLFIACLGCYITASRVFWTLARDNATPFSSSFSVVSPTFQNPFNSLLFCGIIQCHVKSLGQAKNNPAPPFPPSHPICQPFIGEPCIFA